MIFPAAGISVPNLPIVDKNGNSIFGSPIGIIAAYGIGTAPSFWLNCFGQAVSQTTYALLFAVIGFTYGNPGGNNFNVPDLRGRAPYGLDNMGGTAANRITTAGGGVNGTALGSTGGIQAASISQANLPVLTFSLSDSGHTHNYSIPTTSVIGGGGATSFYATLAGSTTGASSTGVTMSSGGSGTAPATMQPALITGYIIYAGI